MSSTLDAFLRSWPFAPWLLAGVMVSAALYLRGWLDLRRRDPRRWHAGHLSAFVGGLAVLYLALASPIEPFSALLLQVHVMQHLLLMMVVPPLLWLGAPLLPILRGLPRPIRVYWIAPLLRSRTLRRVFARLTHPATALPLFVAAAWLWHVPAIYEIALQSDTWHYVQHLCFLGTGLLFWFPVVRPYPNLPRWSLWLLVPYLVLADVQNTVLAALLTFANRVLYPYYRQIPRIGGISALEDQAAAGVLMWVPGSLVFLVPLFAVSIRLLSDPKRPRVTFSTGRFALPLAAPAPPAPFDALRLPLLGRLLRWRHARLILQLPLLTLAVLLIWDGLRGPQVGPMNLAGVLPWIHWRGLLILALLVCGNVFCLACPFTLPRTLARRWIPVGRAWPRWLQSKWPAVLLLVLFLWAYEAFSLWDSPWWTAWIALGYFLAAFVIDGFFRGAAFCKYVCPIGQFNFVHAIVSPLEVKIRSPQVCVSCTGKDCLRGRADIPGCEMGLFQPQKTGNLDCTFCLDCVHACPHDNVGIRARVPASELWHDAFRSGVGRLSRRPDLAALVLVLVFGAFANAAGMVGPILEWQDQFHAPLLTTTAFYVCSLVVVPVLTVGIVSAVSRRWIPRAVGLAEMAARYSFALVPLGFSAWLAHYSYHFLTSYDTALPVTQRFAADLGFSTFGEPYWSAACCRTVAWLPRLEILFLDLGLLLSLYTGYRIARNDTPHPWQALKVLAPWGLLMVSLFLLGAWIVLQPMQMRGTL